MSDSITIANRKKRYFLHYKIIFQLLNFGNDEPVIHKPAKRNYLFCICHQKYVWAKVFLVRFIHQYRIWRKSSLHINELGFFGRKWMYAAITSYRIVSNFKLKSCNWTIWMVAIKIKSSIILKNSVWIYDSNAGPIVHAGGLRNSNLNADSQRKVTDM